MKDLFELDGFRPFDAIVMCVYVCVIRRHVTRISTVILLKMRHHHHREENKIKFLFF